MLSRIVIITLLLLCGTASAQSTQPSTRPAFHVGRIEDPAISESSGVVASRKYPGVYWTLNDSGNPAMIFAIDQTGKTIGRFAIDAKNIDWEDLATDDAGHLYISDTGNNALKRKQVLVHQIDEPDPRSKDVAPIKPKQTWTLTFPKQPFDGESLFVWKDDAYVVSKHRDFTTAGLYRFSLAAQKEPAELAKVCDLPIRMPATGASISPDGKQVAVITVGGPYLFDLPAAGEVKAMATLTPRTVLYTDVHMEAVTFTPAGLLATSEKRSLMMFYFADFGPKK